MIKTKQNNVIWGNKEESLTSLNDSTSERKNPHVGNICPDKSLTTIMTVVLLPGSFKVVKEHSYDYKSIFITIRFKKLNTI